jgi:chromate reductase, NAD(P)H dehydrogenase (quinone)
MADADPMRSGRTPQGTVRSERLPRFEEASRAHDGWPGVLLDSTRHATGAERQEEHMTTYRVGYFVGSLAAASINRLLARALVRLAPPDLQMVEIPFKDLPLYNRDFDADYPPVARDFKNAIAAVDAVLFVTPEYNRSIPGALKNAIDWASRPYGQNSFARKPSGVIGASPGKIGTAVGQQHLRSILGFCNSPQMTSVEAYIQFQPGLITEEGEVTDDSMTEFLTTYMTEWHAFIVRVYTVLPRSTV